MFGLSGSKRSPVRRRIEQVSGVLRTSIEWTIENGLRTPTVVVQYRFDLDPALPDFDADVFAQVMAAANAVEPGEGAPPRLRIVRWMATGD